MNRFIWLVRRETWEHRAIWIAPAILLAVMVAMTFIGDLGPIGALQSLNDGETLRPDQVQKMVLLIYAGVALVVDLVLGVVAFFYALDSLYADRRDRSVLFWKSLPVSDAEAVLSKFAVAALLIPIVGLVGGIVAQLLVGGAAGLKLAMAGANATALWQPGVLAGGAGAAVAWFAVAVPWYAPVIAYLMLISAWAPRGPFLWAVLPPVGLAVLEWVLLRTTVIEDFLTWRLFGMYELLGSSRGQETAAVAGAEIPSQTMRLSQFDLPARIADFYQSPGLWLGLVVAAVLVGAAIWARRYRDETS